MNYSFPLRCGATAFAVAAIGMSYPLDAQAQMPARINSRDTVSVVAGPAFEASGFKLSMLGENYREEWTTPIRVPVLDLRSFAGGIAPFKLGGGKQTKSLRFTTTDSVEYVFRPVYKAGTNLPDDYKGTIVWSIFRDAGSASHPGAAVAAAPLLDAAGVLQPRPQFVVMPDDPLLGEYRKDFAGVLGTIESYPTVPKNAPGFAGAVGILDAEELLAAINKDPSAYDAQGAADRSSAWR